MRGPGYAGKGYAIAVATVDAASSSRWPTRSSTSPPAEVSNADIASLRHEPHRLPLHAITRWPSPFPFRKGWRWAPPLHYLKGKNTVVRRRARRRAVPHRRHRQGSPAGRLVGGRERFFQAQPRPGGQRRVRPVFQGRARGQERRQPGHRHRGGRPAPGPAPGRRTGFPPRRPDGDLPGHRPGHERPLPRRRGCAALLARRGKGAFPEQAVPARRAS